MSYRQEAIYEVEKVLLPLDVVVPNPKAPSPVQGESPKTKSSAEKKW